MEIENQISGVIRKHFDHTKKANLSHRWYNYFETLLIRDKGKLELCFFDGAIKDALRLHRDRQKAPLDLSLAINFLFTGTQNFKRSRWDVRTQKGLLRNQLIDSSSSQWSGFPHWIIVNPIHLSQVAGVTIIAVLRCYVFYEYFFCYCAIKLRIIISRKKSSLYDILNNKKQDERDSGQKIVKKFLLCYLSFDFLLLLEASRNLAGDICDFSHSISY